MSESNIELLEMGVNKQQEEALLLDQTSETQQRKDYIEMLEGKIKYFKTMLASSDESIAEWDQTSEYWEKESDHDSKEYMEYQVERNKLEYKRTRLVCALLEYLDRLEEQIFLISELLKPDEPKDFIPEHSSLRELRDSLEKRLCYDNPVRTFDKKIQKSVGFPCKYKDSYNYKKILSEMINNRSLNFPSREDEKKYYPLIVASDSKGGRKRRKTKKQKKLKKKTKRAVKSNKRRKTKRT